MDEVLPTPETNLEPDGPVAEKTGKIERRAFRVRIPADGTGRQRLQILV